MIAIPNMSKPKICYMCPLSDETWFCPIVGEAIPRANKKLENCPLIELDDELISKFAEAYLEREVEDGNIHT